MIKLRKIVVLVMVSLLLGLVLSSYLIALAEENQHYPGDNTKVTNPDITFHWKRPPTLRRISGYRLEIFKGIRGKPALIRRQPAPMMIQEIITITWKKIISVEVKETSYRELLEHGKFYISIVTPMYTGLPLMEIKPNPVTRNPQTGKITDSISAEIRQKIS